MTQATVSGSEPGQPQRAVNALDSGEFRRALGHYATGVTVITAQAPGGQLVGITANSFNSVSLDPPMVLWSLARSSSGFDLFSSAGHFCVNILAADQVELSNHFARRNPDKFSNLDFEAGAGGAPVLGDCAANFQCRTAFTYEGGDHLIFVGEVLAFHHTGKSGLVFHEGQYRVSEIHPFHADDAGPDNASGFVDDYVDYLLSIAADRFQKKFQRELDKTARTNFEWRVLAVLSDYPGSTFERISTKTLIPARQLRAVLLDMEHNDLVASQSWDYEDEYLLTRKGTRAVLKLLAAAKANEADALAGFSPASVRDFKLSLKKLIQRLSE